MESGMFAYSLCQREDGWNWRIYDEDGVIVADGAVETQSAAQAAVQQTLSHVGRQQSC